jgi:hypothetical protein
VTDNRLFQVEGFLWLRATIPAGSMEEAAERLLGHVSLDEESLAELSQGDYDVESVGGAIVEGRDLDDARERATEGVPEA